MAAYAESLSARNLHEDAALAWLAAGEREAALSSYQEAGEWRQVAPPSASDAIKTSRFDMSTQWGFVLISLTM
jgi:hypothetical protein